MNALSELSAFDPKSGALLSVVETPEANGIAPGGCGSRNTGSGFAP